VQHYIEFLPEARALLAAIILTSRAILVIREIHPSSRTSVAKRDPAAPAPAPAAPTTSASNDGDTPVARPDRMSRIARLTFQAAQTVGAGLALLEWMNKLGLL
jgi:hypothetical protein